MLQRLAQLAALDNKYCQQTLEQEITDILEFVDKLRKVNTKDLTPLFHPLDHAQPLREDNVQSENLVDQLAAIAPQFSNSCYQVPKVIDQEN